MMDFENLRERLAVAFRKYGVKRAVLFGSYVKGENDAKSDIDLCVESGLRGLRFVGLVEEIRENLGGRMVDVLDFSHLEPGSRIAQEIEGTGVLIYEG